MTETVAHQVSDNRIRAVERVSRRYLALETELRELRARIRAAEARAADLAAWAATLPPRHRPPRHLTQRQEPTS